MSACGKIMRKKGERRPAGKPYHGEPECLLSFSYISVPYVAGCHASDESWNAWPWPPPTAPPTGVLPPNAARAFKWRTTARRPLYQSPQGGPILFFFSCRRQPSAPTLSPSDPSARPNMSALIGARSCGHDIASAGYSSKVSHPLDTHT